MINKGLYIALVLIPILGFSQSKKEQLWKKEKDQLEYRKAEQYEGPDSWYGGQPAAITQDEYVSTNDILDTEQNKKKHGIPYDSDHIVKDRENRNNGDNFGGGNGDLPLDPKVKKPDPLEFPDIDFPDFDTPDFDLPKIDPPTISPAVWKTLLVIFIIVVLFIVAYLIIKNSKPPNKKIIVDVENDWNPEVISKSELELRLEEALKNRDYRGCVRVYFTFILKELIQKSWVVWRQEKTNHQYVLEMHKNPGSDRFNECVRIYDLVWYGEYQINEETFNSLKPTLEEYYRSLNE